MLNWLKPAPRPSACPRRWPLVLWCAEDWSGTNCWGAWASRRECAAAIPHIRLPYAGPTLLFREPQRRLLSARLRDALAAGAEPYRTAEGIQGIPWDLDEHERQYLHGAWRWQAKNSMAIPAGEL